MWDRWLGWGCWPKMDVRWLKSLKGMERGTCDSPDGSLRGTPVAGEAKHRGVCQGKRGRKIQGKGQLLRVLWTNRTDGR